MPIRIASAKLAAPAGTTMNSWRSIVLSACAPPLITFIIGTGRTRASVAAEVAEERDARPRRRPPSRPRARRRASRSRRAATCSACRRARSAAWSSAGLVAGVEPAHAPRRSRRSTLRDRLRARPCRRTRVAAVAELDRLVHAGRGARRDGGAAERAGLEARRRPRRSGCRASRRSGGRGRRRWLSSLGLLGEVEVAVLVFERQRRPILARLPRRGARPPRRGRRSGRWRGEARARGRRRSVARR